MTDLSIIHLRSAEFFGGPERAILGQCRSLPEFRFTCASFTRDEGPNRFLDEAAKLGLETARIRDKFAGDFRVVGQLRRLMDEKKADLLITQDYKANFFGRLAVRGRTTRQIAHFRGYTLVDKKDKFYNIINAWTMRRIKVLLTVSEKSKTILTSMGVPAPRIVVVPNAIEDEKLLSPEFRRVIPSDRPLRAVCAGRLSYEKGYDILLRALFLIKDNNPGITVEIYGEGKEETALKRLTDNLDLTGMVKFCGFADNILPILKESDLLILPSRSEGMPNILLEAWSQKIGAVATAVGGVPEMMKGNQGGWLSPPEDPDKLAENIRAAVKDKTHLAAAGENGYQLVKQRYCYKTQAEMLLTLYREIAAGKFDA